MHDESTSLPQGEHAQAVPDDETCGAVVFDPRTGDSILVTREAGDDPIPHVPEPEHDMLADLVAALDSGDLRRAAWLLRLAWPGADPGR